MHGRRAAIAVIIGLLMGCLGATASAESHELNIDGFSSCLRQTLRAPDLTALETNYGFGFGDGFLSYLAVYPGHRIPGESARRQARGFDRWSEDLGAPAATLANNLVAAAASGQSIYPTQVLALADDACLHRDDFCAALVAHNVLRAFARYPESILVDPDTGDTVDHNPAWFQYQRQTYLAALPALGDALISLQTDGGGDRWGDWYHFFGIFAYSLHEMAMDGNLAGAELAVRANQLFNPILVGEPEDPHKARMDRDAVEVARRFLSDEQTSTGIACDESDAYTDTGA